MEDGSVHHHGLIYVPEKLRTEVIAEHHNNPLRGHMGTDRTTELISRNYYFPNMRKKVLQYAQNCDTCQRDKPSRHQPYGQLHPIDAPIKPWNWVTVDFVVKLPKSGGYDSIAVFTDRLTKYIHLVPCNEAMNASEMASVFLKTIITNHGIPEILTSDRDKLFTSHFWQSLADRMGIDHRLTTAYHPQANGQTERTNQTIEQYLRHYVNYQQDDWTEFLPLAQFAYNNSVHATTGETPFFANYGYHPEMMGEPRNRATVSEEARVLVNDLSQLHLQLSRDIDFYSARILHTMTTGTWRHLI